MMTNLEITALLRASKAGDAEALEALIDTVYPMLRSLAVRELRQERTEHTLQPTALVNEAFLRLFGGTGIDWQDRGHFFRVAARQMRRVLISYARKRLSAKRGGGIEHTEWMEEQVMGRVPLDEVVAIDRELERLGQMDARVAEVVELRVFGGLNEEETAGALGVSETTVAREWKFGRTWLYERLRPQREPA